MAGENCTCPNTPCPICHTKVCDCGCGLSEFSEAWQNLHVQSIEEREQRAVLEQQQAEQQVLKDSSETEGDYEGY